MFTHEGEQYHSGEGSTSPVVKETKKEHQNTREDDHEDSHVGVLFVEKGLGSSGDETTDFIDLLINRHIMTTISETGLLASHPGRVNFDLGSKVGIECSEGKAQAAKYQYLKCKLLVSVDMMTRMHSDMSCTDGVCRSCGI